jgi:two-component system OmpR family response regulator
VRILVAEDDPSIREALHFALAQSAYAVDAVADGAAADEALKDHCFGLVILDLGLPRVDGLEVLRRLRRRNRVVPVLILTARQTPDEKVAGLDLGADDYVVKPFIVNELLARVRALLRRGGSALAPMLSYGSLTFDTVERTAAIDGRSLALSAHEVGVLEVLLRRFGHVVSKEHLLEQLYSYDREVTQNVIEVYVHRVRRKIEGAGVAVQTLYGRGYRLDYSADRNPG